MTATSLNANERTHSAVSALADAIVDGIPVCDDVTHEPLMFDGKRVMRPGIPIVGMGCIAADALAELLLLGGHTQAARMVIAEHTTDDDEATHWHIVDTNADRLARLAYATNYLSTTFDATTSTRGPARPDHFVLDVTGANGTPFRVIAYAANAAGPFPAYDPTKARVEVYDRRYPHTEHGQRAASYFLADLLPDGTRPTRGLCLAGGVDAWNIDAATMRLVEQWLTGVASAL